MATQCLQCKKRINLMGNYGPADNPLCFDCANTLPCAECSKPMTISDQIVYDNRKICNECFKKFSAIALNKPIIETQDEENDTIIEPFVSSFKSDDEVERLFYENYRLKIRTNFLVIIPAVLLLPFAGGIKEIISSPLSNIDAVHITCLISYIICSLWLWRMLGRKVILDRDGLTIVNWLKSIYHRFDEIGNIVEIGIPERDMAHQMFAIHKTYLRIAGKSGRHLLKKELTKNYSILKSILEYKLKKKIKYIKREKSDLHRIFEMIP
jgi:hypothetical protein